MDLAMAWRSTALARSVKELQQPGVHMKSIRGGKIREWELLSRALRYAGVLLEGELCWVVRNWPRICFIIVI